MSKQHAPSARAAFTGVVGRKTFRVSTRSLWPDDSWKLDSETKGQRNTIGWKFILPDGSYSTDPAHEILLEGFREVVWGLLTNAGEYNKILSPGSAAPIATGMRELFRWMVKRGWESFSQLDTAARAHYLLDIPLILVSPAKFYEMSVELRAADELDADSFVDEMVELAEQFDVTTHDATDETIEGKDDAVYCDDFAGATAEEDKFTYGQVACRVNTLFYVFSQSKSLKLRGIPVMRDKPFPGQVAGDVVSSVVKHVINRIPPLPDEVAMPLLREALDWINYKADDVLVLQQQFLDARNELPIQGAGPKLNALLGAFRFASPPGSETPWRKKLNDEDVIHPEHGKVTLTRIQGLRRLILRVRSACVTILQYMVGLRAGEICATESGWSAESNLPSCITRRHSKSGLMEMFYLKSVLSKGVDRPTDEDWLLGCRPVGSAFWPAPVRALEVLEKLFRPWRLLAGSDALIISFAQPKALPLRASSVGRITSSELLRGIKQFIYSEVDLSALPDRSERNEDLTGYRETKGLCVRTSQGRKTFAAYVLETRASLLQAVSEHFKHLSVATTQEGYFPKASQLHSEAQTVIFSETVAFFMGATEGRPMAGRMAPLIAKYFSGDEWQEIADYAEREQQVEALVKTHDLRIFFNDYGNCLIRTNPLESRCQQAAGAASWDAVTPNYAAKSPGICSGCGAFVIDASHLPFWVRRDTELSTVLEGAEADGNSREFFVLKQRVAQARKIIKLVTASAND